MHQVYLDYKDWKATEKYSAKSHKNCIITKFRINYKRMEDQLCHSSSSSGKAAWISIGNF